MSIRADRSAGVAFDRSRIGLLISGCISLKVNCISMLEREVFVYVREENELTPKEPQRLVG